MTPEIEARLRQDVEVCRFVATAVHYHGSDKDQLAADIEAALKELEKLREVYAWASAILTALNVGDIRSGSPLHLKLREVLVEYRK